MVYNEIAERFRSRGFIPLLRQEEGKDIVVAYPAPAGAGRPRPVINLLLFVATVMSTLLAGAYQAVGADPLLAAAMDRASAAGLLHLFLDNWTAGVPFTAALLGILGVHEFGHYFVARYYKLDVSLPYFIPFPLNPLTGTLGAVIKIQSPFESRKALFDVGIAGPLAGLAIAIPVTAFGLMTAKLTALPPGEDLFIFNEPLLFQWMARLIVGVRPEGSDILMNPFLMAGWWGFLITALNLVPISQLDGGHVSYALFGHHHRFVSWGVFLSAVLVALRFTHGFAFMLALVFLMGIEHPPALNDLTPIGTPRKVLGSATLLLFLTLITIVPFG